MRIVGFNIVIRAICERYYSLVQHKSSRVGQTSVATPHDGSSGVSRDVVETPRLFSVDRQKPEQGEQK